MFDWPHPNHTSPKRTLVIECVSLPHLAVIVDGFLFAFCAGSFTVQRPFSSAVASPTVFPLSATDTFAPGSAKPHTGDATSR